MFSVERGLLQGADEVGCYFGRLCGGRAGCCVFPEDGMYFHVQRVVFEPVVAEEPVVFYREAAGHPLAYWLQGQDDAVLFVDLPSGGAFDELVCPWFLSGCFVLECPCPAGGVYGLNVQAQGYPAAASGGGAAEFAFPVAFPATGKTAGLCPG